MDIEILLVVTKEDNNNLKICCVEEIGLELYGFFECYIPNYHFNPKYKQGIWNGKISFYNRHTCLLPLGLLYRLPEFAKMYGYQIALDFDTDTFINKISDSELHDFYKKIFKNSPKKIYPRDYQHECISASLRKKRGVIESATASGKSLVIYSIICWGLKQKAKKILLVVPSITLTTQMFDEFADDYGWKGAHNHVSILYGNSDRYDEDKKILISTWQSIYNKDESFFKDFEMVIVDECHGVGSIPQKIKKKNGETITKKVDNSNSLQKILKKCVNADFRIGLTGTLPEQDVEIYNIYGSLGPKLASIKTAKLIKDGYLSNILIANLLIQYSQEDIKKNKKRSPAEEERFIISNQNRNKIFDYIIKNINTNDNVLILCQKIDHVKSIYEYIKKMVDGTSREAFLIYGDIKKEKRDDIIKYIRNAKGKIIVATFGTFAIGVNIKNLHHVIAASSYKSKIKILQSIGRGLRKHESKDKVVWWDIVDDMRWKKQKRSNSTSEYGYNRTFEHFLVRLERYKSEKFKCINKLVDLSKIS